MATCVKKAPFVMQFGEFLGVEGDDGWFYCEEKNVMVHTESLIEGIKRLGAVPLRTKYLVGGTIKSVPVDRSLDHYDNPNNVFLWRDENKTHIGCLWEYTRDFNRKYVELNKHLNNK